MSKLVIKFNNEVLDHMELKQGDMKIGRKPGCEIVLDNLAVSGEHANIFTIGEDSFVQDLNSTNGTFVNNKRIAKHHLRNGDAIAIGQHALIFFQDSARPLEPSRSDDFAKTVIISPTAAAASKPPAAPPPASAETPAGPSERRAAALFVLNGKTSGRRIELTKTVTNLGKTGRPAGIIMRTPEGYILRASKDGDKPKLNGQAIAGDAKLRNGDVVEVAGTRLQFNLK